MQQLGIISEGRVPHVCACKSAVALSVSSTGSSGFKCYSGLLEGAIIG
jgi:hypothetical protein